MTSACTPSENRLLAALPDADLAYLLPELELVSLSRGDVLRESGIRMRHAYFPATAIVSMVYVMTDGGLAEIAVQGNEGLVDFTILMGGDTTPSTSVVQVGGFAYRMSERVLREAFERRGQTQALLLRYTQALITQMAQTVVCNRHHTLEQRFYRSLLLTLDRSSGDEVAMTHEWMANRIAVRREGVTEAARKAQEAGLIRYQRGHVTVLNRAGLEARSCECYAVVRREYERLLPQRSPAIAASRLRDRAADVPASAGTRSHLPAGMGASERAKRATATS